MGAQPTGAQPMGAQPTGAQPMGAQRAPGGGGSKKGLLVAGGVAVVAAIVIAVAVSHHGGGGGGLSSAKDVFQAAIDRASKGDVEGLVALGGADSFADELVCKDKDKDPSTMRKAMLERMTEEMTGYAKAWKGVGGSVESLDPKGKPDVMTAGNENHGCTTKDDIITQDYKVNVKVNDAVTTLRFSSVEVGGRFYLSDMPEQPPVSTGQIGAMRDSMCACKDRACAKKVEADYTAVMDKAQAEIKAGKAPGPEMMKAAEEMDACRTKAFAAH